MGLLKPTQPIKVNQILAHTLAVKELKNRVPPQTTRIQSMGAPTRASMTKEAAPSVKTGIRMPPIIITEPNPKYDPVLSGGGTRGPIISTADLY